MKKELYLVLKYKDVYNLVHALGYRWSSGFKRRSRILESDQKVGDTFRLALEWSQALQLEAAGTHVIVYMDESFVNTGHCHRFSWFLVEKSLATFDSRGTFIL